MLIQLKDGVPTGYPVDDYNFRTLFPQVSFPSRLTPSDVEPFGFGMYEYSQEPNTERYQKIVEGAPQKGDNGIWYQNWIVADMDDEEKAEVDSRQAESIRALRSTKLMLSDWTQLADSPVNGAEWLGYRQALRDVPSQAGFPWDVIWPEQPA